MSSAAITPHLILSLCTLLCALLATSGLSQAASSHHEVVIVGAGPAGLQLAYFLSRAKRDYVVLDRAPAPGSFFRRYPRHRRLISLNKISTGSTDPDFNLRHDWNSLIVDNDDRRGNLLFKNYSQQLLPPADAMLDYLHDYAEKYQLNVRYNTTVKRITKFRGRSSEGLANFKLELLPTDHSTMDNNKNGYSAEDNDEEAGGGDDHQHSGGGGGSDYMTARIVVVATGMSVPAYPRTAPGIQLTEGYEDFDPATAHTKYLGKRVLILGTGNSAFEVANNISGVANIVQLCSRNPPKFSWQTHYAGDVRSANAEFLDMYQLKAQHFISTCIVSSQSAVLQHPDGQLEYNVPFTPDMNSGFDEEVMENQYMGKSHQRGFFANSVTFDYIIRAMGFKFDRSIFANQIKPDMDQRNKYPQMSPTWESVNVPNVFFAGTIMAGRDNRRSSVFAIHGFRFAVRSLFNALEKRFHDIPWPGQNLPHDSAALAGAMIERMQYSGSLYQMFSTMCEAFYYEPECSEEHQKDAAGEFIKTPNCWRHETELPCDMLFTNEAYVNRSFFTLTLEYHPDFGKTRQKMDVFGEDRIDPALHPDEGHRSNFLHPVIRYFTGLKYNGQEHRRFLVVNPTHANDAADVTEWQSHKYPSQAVAIHHVMESVMIDFAHLEGHIEPLVRFIEGLFATRPELLPPHKRSPIDRVAPRRFIHTASREPRPKAPRGSLHAQPWIERSLNLPPEDLRAAYEHTIKKCNISPQQFANAAAQEPEWHFSRVYRAIPGAYVDYGQGPSGEGGEGSMPGMSQQEQFAAFGEQLKEALDRPIADMPELDDIQSVAARAKEAQDRLEQKVLQAKERRSQKLAAAGKPVPEKSSVDIEAIKTQDHAAVARGMVDNDGHPLSEAEQSEAAAIMEGAGDIIAQLDNLKEMFGSFMDTAGGADSEELKAKLHSEMAPGKDNAARKTKKPAGKKERTAP